MVQYIHLMSNLIRSLYGPCLVGYLLISCTSGESFIQLLDLQPSSDVNSNFNCTNFYWCLKIMHQRSVSYNDEVDIIEHNIFHQNIVYPPDHIPSNYYERNYTAFVEKNISHNLHGIKEVLLYNLPYWMYITDNFDCSDMSAYLEHKFELYGFDARICISHNFKGKGINHAWICIDLPEEERYYIETTQIDETISIDGVDYPIIGPQDSSYIDYTKHEAIYEDIYEACTLHFIEDFNWWSEILEWDVMAQMVKWRATRFGVNPSEWTEW